MDARLLLDLLSESNAEPCSIQFGHTSVPDGQLN